MTEQSKAPAPANGETTEAEARPVWFGRHPSTQHFELLFSYAHLPAGKLRNVSAQCSVLAELMVDRLPDGPELSTGLRKLLEAKDCFVRAAVLQASRGTATAR